MREWNWHWTSPRCIKKLLPLFIPIFNRYIHGKSRCYSLCFHSHFDQRLFFLFTHWCGAALTLHFSWCEWQQCFCAFLLSMSHMWLGKKLVCHWNRHVLSWHKISHKYYLIDASREQVNAQHRDCCHDRKEKKWKAQDDWLIRDEKNEPVDFTADLSALSTTTLYMQCMHLFKWSR